MSAIVTVPGRNDSCPNPHVLYTHTHTHTHTHTRHLHIAGKFISDDAIRDAIRNVNACNPIFLTFSRIILQIANEQNATRVELIRRMIEGITDSGTYSRNFQY